jgi:hypothetical protein
VRFRFAGDGGVRTLSLSDSISPTGRFRFLSRSAKASSASSWKLLPLSRIVASIAFQVSSSN